MLCYLRASLEASLAVRSSLRSARYHSIRFAHCSRCTCLSLANGCGDAKQPAEHGVLSTFPGLLSRGRRPEPTPFSRSFTTKRSICRSCLALFQRFASSRGSPTALTGSGGSLRREPATLSLCSCSDLRSRHAVPKSQISPPASAPPHTPVRRREFCEFPAKPKFVRGAST